VDRISQVLNGQTKAAVFPLVCADHCAHLLKLEFSEVATNGKKLADVLTYGYELYQYDMVLVFSDPYVEAQSMGCPVELDPYPTLRGPKSSKRIDRTNEIFKAAETLKQKLDVPVFVSIKGPFSLAAFLGGIENFLKLLLKKELEAFKLLDEAMRFQEDYLNRLLTLGVNVFIGDPLSSSSVISPTFFAKYALPGIKALVQKIKAHEVLAGLHICGDTRPIIQTIDRIGADILSIENITTRTKTIRMGGVSTHTILSGNKSGIASEVTNALSSKPIILSTSCDVPPQTNPGSIKTMLSVAREHRES